MTRALILAALCLAACGPSRPAAPTRHVTDMVYEANLSLHGHDLAKKGQAPEGFLSRQTVFSLETELAAYKELTGHHVLVYVTGTSGGQIHSEWCLNAFNSWGVGRPVHDDGVVLFYFPQDRVVWITVGYGLERAIPDREAARIYRDVVSPAIRAGRPDDGIVSGVAEILRLIDKADAAKGRP